MGFLVATIHFLPFTRSFRRIFAHLFTVRSAMRTLNSHNHSFFHYSLNSQANVITCMYTHYSRRMVLANAPPFTCLLAPKQAQIIENKQTNRSGKGFQNPLLDCVAFVTFSSPSISARPWHPLNTPSEEEVDCPDCPKLGRVIAQAFFSRGPSENSLKSRFFFSGI